MSHASSTNAMRMTVNFCRVGLSAEVDADGTDQSGAAVAEGTPIRAADDDMAQRRLADDQAMRLVLWMAAAVRLDWLLLRRSIGDRRAGRWATDAGEADSTGCSKRTARSSHTLDDQKAKWGRDGARSVGDHKHAENDTMRVQRKGSQSESKMRGAAGIRTRMDEWPSHHVSLRFNELCDDWCGSN